MNIVRLKEVVELEARVAKLEKFAAEVLAVADEAWKEVVRLRLELGRGRVAPIPTPRCGKPGCQVTAEHVHTTNPGQIEGITVHLCADGQARGLCGEAASADWYATALENVTCGACRNLLEPLESEVAPAASEADQKPIRFREFF